MLCIILRYMKANVQPSRRQVRRVIPTPVDIFVVDRPPRRLDVGIGVRTRSIEALTFDPEAYPPMKTDIGIWTVDPSSRAGSKLRVTDRVETEEMLEDALVANPDMLMSGLTLVGRQAPLETGFVDLVGIDEPSRPTDPPRTASTAQATSRNATKARPDSPSAPSGCSCSVSGPMRAPTEWCPNWRTGPSNIRLVTFHGQVHGQEMLLARQVRAADDTRTSSAGPPGARDLNRKATERGVAAIRQDARKSLDYSVRTYYMKVGITYLQRTTTLPDGVHVRGLRSVTIGEPGEIRITFYPAAGDLCYEEFEQLGDAFSFEGGKRPNAPGTRRAPDRWYCGWEGGEEGGDGGSGRGGRALLELMGIGTGEVGRATRRWGGAEIGCRTRLTH